VNKDYELLARRSGLMAGAMTDRQSRIGAGPRGPAATDFWLSAVGEPANVVGRAVMKVSIVAGPGAAWSRLVAQSGRSFQSIVPRFAIVDAYRISAP
jgi:hypothetical protein